MTFNIKFNEKGLVPVITQDVESKIVLMLGYANEEALGLTMETKIAHYYSRSRQRIWKKGETSGNTQQIIDIRHDCDNDTLLYIVKQKGHACHVDGCVSCFDVPQELILS